MIDLKSKNSHNKKISLYYDYEQYWEEEGRNPVETKAWFKIQVNKLIEILNGFQFDSVLEIGCGEGRITKLLLNNYKLKNYTAIDISKDRIEKAKNNIKKITNNCKINFVQTTFQNFKSTQKYDLVIAVEVLMHVPPDEIEFIIKKMISFSKTYTLNLDYYPKKDAEFKEEFKRNFLHYYPSIYDHQASQPQKLSFVRITPKQAIFFAEKINVKKVS